MAPSPLVEEAVIVLVVEVVVPVVVAVAAPVAVMRARQRGGRLRSHGVLPWTVVEAAAGVCSSTPRPVASHRSRRPRAP